MLHLSLAVLAALTLLNLWLVLDAKKTLARIDSTLQRMFVAPEGAHMLPSGFPVGDFSATTTDGEQVTADALTGWTLVAVVSPDCTPCQEALPGFLETAQAMPGGRAQVLALVVHPGTVPPALLQRLEPVARTVVGEAAERAAAALTVESFPAFLLVGPDRVVAYSGRAVDLSLVPVVPAE